MSNKLFYIIAIVLVAVAAGLGYMLLMPQSSNNEAPVAVTPPQVAVTPTTTPEPAAPAPEATAPAAPTTQILPLENLDVPTVKTALAFPKDGAPQEAYKTQFDALSKLVKDSSEMQIGQGCATVPRFVRAKEGSMISLRNVDVVSHKLYFAPGHEVVVEGGKSASVKFDFIKAPGLNGYVCDPSKDNGISGVIMIVK